jgi:IS30 family transposase
MGHIQDNAKLRKWKQLNERDRYQIELLVRMGKKSKAIAEQIGRDRRTIDRELERGTVKQITSELEYIWVYKADAGQRVHQERAANKGRGLKIGKCHKLAKHIERMILVEKQSPDAIIGRIAEQGWKYEVRICTKTVYNYIDAEIFAGISNKDLPVKKREKRPYAEVRRVALNNIKGRSIEERPDMVKRREEQGHWEMDCVTSGKGGRGCLLVLTERSSRNELLFKMKAQKQEYVIEVIDRLERKHKGKFSERFKSITMDNGCEFLDHARLESSILKGMNRRTTVFYAHPYSAWERGSNEVANKLIRRFIPKGANIALYSNQEIKRIEYWMNNYPRRIFGYMTAKEVYEKNTSGNR